MHRVGDFLHFLKNKIGSQLFDSLLKNNESLMTNICLTSLFYQIDEQIKNLTNNSNISQLLARASGQRGPARRMTSSEMITLIIYFGFSGYKTFKDYYLRHVQYCLKSYFPSLYSYNRFIQLMGDLKLVMKTLSLIITIKNRSAENCLPEVFYVDSYPLNVCHNKRISSHKVFKNFAQHGKTSTGWFFGFKLHVVINVAGDIVSAILSTGNIVDNNTALLKQLLEGLQGKVFGDKGYLIKPELRKYFFDRKIQLITKIRSNMQNVLVPILDKFLLRSRGIIESVGNVLKNTFLLEHSRHRSIQNFCVHIFATIIAYFFKPEKPSLSFEKIALLTA